MIVAELAELFMHPVVDRGVPNLERVPIYVRDQVGMGQFGLMIGSAVQPGLAIPIRDSFFWFGDGIVNPGDWILVYTGSGIPRTDDWNNPPGSKVYSVHWGRSKTMFANTNIVPILFKTNSVQVGASPSDVPQIGAINS
jgi:hypothetical protein